MPTELPDSQYLIAGESGKRKSTLAACFPKPMLVIMFDSSGKAWPYLRRGKRGPLEYDKRGTPYHEVFSLKTGKQIIRVEYYSDPDPARPNALFRYLQRVSELGKEAETWRTYVLDSATGMAIQGYNYYRYAVHHNNGILTKQQNWDYLNAITATMKEQIFAKWMGLPGNVVLTAHMTTVTLNRGKDNERSVLRIKAPGELKDELASQFPEVYYAYIDIDRKTREPLYLLQTSGEVDEGLVASSQFMIEGPVGTTYKALCEAPNGIGEGE